MIRKSTENKVSAAFDLLKKHGFRCYVPGCYDIASAKEAVEFDKDPAKFYEDARG